MSAKPAFTPGPWKATPNGYGVWFVHGGADLVAGTGTKYRALVCGGNDHDTLTESNARFIAAAPDLHKALAALVARTWEYVGREPFPGGEDLECDAEMRTLANAGEEALAKALGE